MVKLSQRKVTVLSIQMDEILICKDVFDVDLTVLDPVISLEDITALGKCSDRSVIL